MRKVFWDAPYQTKLITQIDTVDANWILPTATIAFSLSGGQESDHGCIDDYPILHSKIEGTDIFYDLGTNHGLNAGQ